jgi:hypothetical protein
LEATSKERLKKLHRGYLIIGAASFNNSLGLIRSGPDAFVGFSTFRTSSTSCSHNLISLIWFAACDKLGILLLSRQFQIVLKNIY